MITQTKLKELFHYDKDTGLLTRIKCTANRHKFGEVITGKEIRIENRTYSKLKLIWLYHYGEYPKTNVIRLDQDSTNNKINNLVTSKSIKNLIFNLDTLKAFLNYDKNSGEFTWKLTTNSSIPIGSKAGFVQGTLPDGGYVKINFLGKTYNAHHLAWMYEYGYLPIDQIDHINQERTDNRICNLREVTIKDNMKNKSLYKNNSSGVCGVYKKGSKWAATINGKKTYLGTFNTKEEAIAARKAADIVHNYHENHGSLNV